MPIIYCLVAVLAGSGALVALWPVIGPSSLLIAVLAGAGAILAMAFAVARRADDLRVRRSGRPAPRSASRGGAADATGTDDAREVEDPQLKPAVTKAGPSR